MTKTTTLILTALAVLVAGAIGACGGAGAPDPSPGLSVPAPRVAGDPDGLPIVAEDGRVGLWGTDLRTGQRRWVNEDRICRPTLRPLLSHEQITATGEQPLFMMMDSGCSITCNCTSGTGKCDPFSAGGSCFCAMDAACNTCTHGSAAEKRATSVTHSQQG